jgi:hypothetical protein
MLTVAVDTEVLRKRRLIGPGQSIRRLARYLRPHVRAGMLNIFSESRPRDADQGGVTLIGLANETDVAACLAALAKLPDGGIQGRRRQPGIIASRPR